MTTALGTESPWTLAWWRSRLFEPLDVASLAVFRVMFGTVMLWEVWSFFDAGWIESYYIQPRFFFKYYGFEWVEPWGGEGMYWHYALLGVLALQIIAGFLYRFAMAAFFLAVTYVFLLDQTQYLNHYYLVCLLSFLMIFLPLHRGWSIDAVLRPALASETVPAWPLWLLRAQLGIVYFYAGVAKLNADWLQCQPIRMWVRQRMDFPIIGPLLEHRAAPYFFGYGGLLLDLFVVPFLLWRRTRPYAFAATVLFHVLNNWLFSIGLFPWLMLAATLLFFEPGWPRRFCLLFPPRPQGVGTAAPVPLVPPGWRRTVVLVFLGVWVAIQILVPLRHWLYPGSVHWNEEGHRFAWHMKLRDKRGTSRFFVTDPGDGTTREVNPSEHLTPSQVRKMPTRPDMTLQFAHYLARTLPRAGTEPLEVRVDARVRLNGREPAQIIDPQVDLARIPRTLGHCEWVLPLTEPLKRPRPRPGEPPGVAP
jgi:hypothetical protein